MADSVPVVRIVDDAVEGSVEIAAPPETVFRAISDPQQLVQWWGSHDEYWVTAWHGDLRVGGEWRCEGRNRRGGLFTVHGVYEVVDPPRRLVHTWESSWRPGVRTRVEYFLEPLGEGTEIRVRHSGFAGDSAARADMQGGLPSVLLWLRGFLHGTHRNVEIGG